MGYRGEDLDLRTPQTWSATPADLASASDVSSAGARGSARNGPIWVDDTVLACSNHAYDIALAHRAGEVRIEHLLHALTRIDAAAEALEARGVRVAGLRRETATIIASEIPVGLPNGKGSPRRSEDFAEVVRLAAANAARRNAPASIEDLLYVLFDQRTDLPALNLLQRNMMRTSAVREAAEPLPPLTRFPAQPRYAPPPQPERYIPRYQPEPPRVQYRTEYVAVPQPVAAPQPQPQAVVIAQPLAEPVRDSRIDTIEQLVRSLHSTIAADRQNITTLLNDVVRDAQSGRDDQGRLQSSLHERIRGLEMAVAQTPSQQPQSNGLVEQLQAIETGLGLRLQEMSQSWATLSSRLQELEMAVRQSAASEKTVRAPQLDLSPVTNRLDIIEEALLSQPQPQPSNGGDIATRLKSLESEISRALSSNAQSSSRFEQLVSRLEQRSATGSSPAPDFSGHFSSLAETIETHQENASGLSNQLLERMAAVEQALAAEIGTAAAKHQAYAQDLGEVHDALMKLNQNQHTLAGSIDQWRSESSSDIASIANNVANFDRAGALPLENIEALANNVDTMNKFMIERYHRRHRFWYWLFGTDDWIGTSWPSQVASIETERQRMKPVLRR